MIQVSADGGRQNGMAIRNAVVIDIEGGGTEGLVPDVKMPKEERIMWITTFANRNLIAKLCNICVYVFGSIQLFSAKP